jgi:hypothetical protein|tara:strand:- start:93 stop:206 length:114 start_codon:yes stop_codon:yes gene_type:complete
MLEQIQIKKSPRRPLIVVGHCRRMLLSAVAAKELMLL